jgi:enamidase
MVSVIIRNIGTTVTGSIRSPIEDWNSLLIEDGVIRDINVDGSAENNAKIVIDAGGMTLTPGLYDSHTHPVFGGFSPRLKALDWVESYLQGGITSMISTGELHLPGRPHDPQGVKALAILASKSFRNERPSGVKVLGGTLVLETGLVEKDFEEVANAGVRAVKFIQAISDRDEAKRFSRWAKQYGMKVIIHCGGTSLPDVPTSTAETIVDIEPDVLAHLNGGPTALSTEDIDYLVRKTPWAVDLIRFGNLRLALRIIEQVLEIDALERVILGTDSPTGSGMEPLGILHLITTLVSLSSLKPEQAICMATGNTGCIYDLPAGRIEVGAPADLVLLDAPLGGQASTALESMSIGDIPAVGMVMIDGEVKVIRSRMTPPTQKRIMIL